MRSFLLGAAVLVVGCFAATYDEGLTRALTPRVREPSLLFSFGRVKAPRRTAGGDSQLLLSIEFEAQHKLEVLLDRKDGAVVFETTMGAEVERQPLPLEEAGPRTILKHLLVELQQEGAGVATVYVGCRRAGSVQLPMTPRQMAGKEDKALTVHRGRQVDVSLDANVAVAQLLKKLGCADLTLQKDAAVQSQSNEVYTYRREFGGLMSPSQVWSTNTSRVDAQVILSMYQEPLELIMPQEQQVDWLPGDIPVQHEEESGTLLVKTLTELIETIKELQIEIQTQREETALLRDALLNCEACKPGRGSRRLK